MSAPFENNCEDIAGGVFQDGFSFSPVLIPFPQIASGATLNFP
jgi:hypothetical protein